MPDIATSESEPLRVVHIDTGRSWRGGQQQVYLLHRELLGRGHDSRLLARAGGALLDRCLAEGIPVKPLPGWQAWAELVARRATRDADLVHAHDSKAAGAAAFACVGHRQLASVCHRRVSYPVRKRLTRSYKYRHVQRWIAVSEEVGRILRAAGVEDERLRVIPSALDLDSFRRQAAAIDGESLRREHLIPPTVPIVGLTGALEPQKGHEVLIQAAPTVLQRVPEAVFVCVGDGSRSRRLRHEVAARGLDRSFRLPGFLENVAPLTALYTVAVAPSIGGEGSSGALKEAMALSKPVVATNLAGHQEVLGDGGILVPVGDSDALAESVERLLTDREGGRRLGQRGARAVERYRPERMADAVLEVYRELVRGLDGPRSTP